jgi:predicted RNase H-like nuclease (RuvC/YqgF family)
MVMEYGMTNTEKELLRKNVKELQLQLRDAHIRIKELNIKIDELRRRLGIEQEFTTADGWAMPVENPDALHIKEDKDD